MAGKGFGKLQRELKTEFLQSQGVTVSSIVALYARKKPNGKIMRCIPSQEEIGAGFGDMGWASNGKAIYDTVHIARVAGRKMEQAGAPRLRAYVCPRSRHAHAHLTSKRK